MEGQTEYYLVLKSEVKRAINLTLENSSACLLLDLYGLEDVVPNKLQLADFYIVWVYESDVEEFWYEDELLKVIDYDLIHIVTSL